MIKIFADAQYTTLAVHVPRKRPVNRGLRQRVAEDLASSGAHLVELRFAVGVRHEQDYMGRIIKTVLTQFLVEPNLQSFPAARADVPRRNGLRLRSAPVSSAPEPTQPEPRASPADQTDRARR